MSRYRGEHSCPIGASLPGGNRRRPSQRHSWLGNPWDGSSGAGGGMWLCAGMCSSRGGRSFGAGWESDPAGEQPGRRRGTCPWPPAPIKMLDTDLQVKRQGDRRPFHRACCSPQKGGFQGRGAGMRAAAGGQSRHHCPRSLGEGVMLTQGFLPAKGVGGRGFPPSLARFLG